MFGRTRSTSRDTPDGADSAVRRRMRAWYRRPPGTLLMAAEREEVDRLLPFLFGYHIVQLGSLGRERDYLRSSRIHHRVIVDLDRDNGAGDAGLCARADSLPLATDSVDALVLVHSLELEVEPHQVLREAERVLIPEGHLLIVGFNPWSLWGLWRLFRQRSGRVPWCLRFLSPQRVKDWLALLGFDIVHETGMFFRPPLGYVGLMRHLVFLEKVGRRLWPFLAGGYLILARKRVATLTPIRPRWRRKSVVAGLAEPTMRGYRKSG